MGVIRLNSSCPTISYSDDMARGGVTALGLMSHAPRKSSIFYLLNMRVLLLNNTLVRSHSVISYRVGERHVGVRLHIIYFYFFCVTQTANRLRHTNRLISCRLRHKYRFYLAGVCVTKR